MVTTGASVGCVVTATDGALVSDAVVGSAVGVSAMGVVVVVETVSFVGSGLTVGTDTGAGKISGVGVEPFEIEMFGTGTICPEAAVHRNTQKRIELSEQHLALSGRQDEARMAIVDS